MQKDPNKEDLAISFGGCGFLGVYHAGVGQCVCEHAPHLFSKFSTFYGASAGAITAVSAACRCDPMEAYKWVKKTFEASRKTRLGMLHPLFDLYGRLRDFLEEFLPKNAHRLCRNRVKISLTRLGDNGIPTNLLVTDFNTRKELINAIIASSFIPGYAGFKDLPKFRGKRCFDGGFTSNIPCLADSNVITVSPFSGTCDISPQGESCSPYMLQVCNQPIQLSAKNLHRLVKSLCPTSWDELEELFYCGYKDAKRFFTSEGFFKEPVVEPNSPSGQVTPVEEAPSECFSLCSSTNCPSQAMANSVSPDLLSCVDEEEEKQIEVDLKLASLQRRRASCVYFDAKELDGLDVKNEKRWWEKWSSMTTVLFKPHNSLTKLSTRSWLWRVQNFSPSQVPLLSGLCEKVCSSFEGKSTREHQLSDRHFGLIGSVLKSLTGSMVAF